MKLVCNGQSAIFKTVEECVISEPFKDLERQIQKIDLHKRIAVVEQNLW